ncbi:MAG: AraC family transcriptional regulator [Chitinophagaceae bacterium]|nr:MAG: AraC family transcriptional regulator [Chitinophagaceae bacterium]
MQNKALQSCHLGPDISPEQFIPEHFFICLLRGSMKAYDGNKVYNVQPGTFYIARKNHLVRYTKYKEDGQFQKIIITLDEKFLRSFNQRHPVPVSPQHLGDSFIVLEENPVYNAFIKSLEPYYSNEDSIDDTFADLKREELLLIITRYNPELTNILFDFGAPEKLNLEEFMNKNFRFNVSLERFAFLTGRSLSSFKRDFQKTFGISPGAWLKKKRLEEAYFLISSNQQKPSDVYLEVGFEDLSHFSFVFKKEFGKAPSELLAAS